MNFRKANVHQVLLWISLETQQFNVKYKVIDCGLLFLCPHSSQVTFKVIRNTLCLCSDQKMLRNAFFFFLSRVSIPNNSSSENHKEKSTNYKHSSSMYNIIASLCPFKDLLSLRTLPPNSSPQQGCIMLTTQARLRRNKWEFLKQSWHELSFSWLYSPSLQVFISPSGRSERLEHIVGIVI